jgi:hypothetical protein
MQRDIIKGGRVLVLGTIRVDNTARSVPMWRAQIYDPKAGTISWLPNSPIEITDPIPAPIDGTRVLLSGTVNPDYANVLSSEVFDGSRDDFSMLGGEHPHRSGFTATTLTDGSVLIAGGSGDALPYNDQQAVLFCP